MADYDSQKIALRLNGPPVKLERPFKRGTIIDFCSMHHLDLNPDPYTATDNTSVQLLNDDGDILLRVSYRRRDNQIVVDSQLRRASSGFPETMQMRRGFREEGKAALTITNYGDEYGLVFNNAFFHGYRKRILGDATAVSYRAVEGQSLMFCDPFVTEVVYHKREADRSR